MYILHLSTFFLHLLFPAKERLAIFFFQTTNAPDYARLRYSGKEIVFLVWLFVWVEGHDIKSLGDAYKQCRIPSCLQKTFPAIFCQPKNFFHNFNVNGSPAIKFASCCWNICSDLELVAPRFEREGF